MHPHRPQHHSSMNSSITKKHVHFGESDVHSVEKAPREDRYCLWYQSDELHDLFEQDLEKAHNESSAASDDEAFTARGLELQRGLNLLVDEQKNRPIKSYMKDVLGIYQYGKVEYGSADPDMLRSFAASRSEKDRERAQYLGKQDEQEAYKSYVV